MGVKDWATQKVKEWDLYSKTITFTYNGKESYWFL